MGSSTNFPQPLAIAVVALAVILLVVLWSSGYGSEKRSLRVTAPVLGLFLLGYVLYAQIRFSIGPARPGVASESVLSVEQPAPAGPPDRVQCVLAVFDSEGVTAPMFLVERVLELPPSGPVSFELPELGYAATIEWPDRGNLESIFVRTDLEQPGSIAMSQHHGVKPTTIDAGDARPFLMNSGGLDGNERIALLRSGTWRHELVFRPLYPGESTGSLAAADAAMAIGDSFRSNILMATWFQPAKGYSEDGVARLLSDVHPLGGALLVLGVLLLLAGSVSLLPSGFIALVVLLVAASASARWELRGAGAALIADHPVERIDAAQRLARARAFAGPAAAKLNAAFRNEADETVRSALVLATAAETNPMVTLPPAAEMVNLARSDESAKVQRIATYAADRLEAWNKQPR